MIRIDHPPMRWARITSRLTVDRNVSRSRLEMYVEDDEHAFRYKLPRFP